jgi:hypothetical protein
MEQQYKLVFSGQLRPGKTSQDVKPLLTQLLKLSDQSLQQLFNNPGKAVVLKKVDTLEQAEALCKKFNAIGMIVEIKSSNTASQNRLTLSEKAPDKVIEKTENNDADETAATGFASGAIRALIGWPVILLALALVLLFNYSPYPDGYLKYGFVTGIFVSFLAFKSFMSRLLVTL